MNTTTTPARAAAPVNRKAAIAAALLILALLAGATCYADARGKDKKKARDFFNAYVKEEQDIAALQDWDAIAPMVRKYYAPDAVVSGVVFATGAAAPQVDLKNATVTRDEYIALFEKNMEALQDYNFEIEPPAIHLTPALRYAALSYDLKERGLLKGMAGPRGFPLQLTSTGRCALLLDMKTMLIRKAQCGLMADVQEKPATEVKGQTVQ
jgi:hypothetical protein